VLVYIALHRGLYHTFPYAEGYPEGAGELPVLDHMDGHRHREHVRHLPQMAGGGYKGLKAQIPRGMNNRTSQNSR